MSAGSQQIQSPHPRLASLWGAGRRALARLSPFRRPLARVLEQLAASPKAVTSLTVGGYRLEKLLHANPLGWVFLGQAIASERPEPVHVRVFRPQAWPEVRSEVVLYSQLSHPRLWPLRTWGEQDGCGFVVTPFVEPFPLTRLNQTCHDALFFEFLRGVLPALEVARRAGMRCQHWSAEQFALVPGLRGVRLVFDLGLPLQASSSVLPREGSLRARLAQFCATRQPTLTLQAILDRLQSEPDGDLLEALEALVEASPLNPSEKAELLVPLELMNGVVCPRGVEQWYDGASVALEEGDLSRALTYLLGGMEVNPHIPSVLLGKGPQDQAPHTRLSADSLAWAQVYARQAQDRWPEAHLRFLQRVLADPSLGAALRHASRLQFELQRGSLLPSPALAEEVRNLRLQFYGKPVDSLFQRLGLTCFEPARGDEADAPAACP